VTAAAEAGATLVSLVPTALARIDAAHFRGIVLGGSHPPEDRPANVVTTYGLTETGSGVVYDGVPLAGVDVRVGDGGAISLRGPMLLRAYRDDTDPKDAEGWLPTGDVGTWQYTGGGRRLVVHGRVGDLIITGGENVWPEPVERALAAAPGVAEVAVAGRPDPEWGQRVVAFVVPADAGHPPTLEQLRAVAKEHVAPFAAPRELVLVRTLARTALGKVRRDALP
jgi:O-succinylbenzoic acid--CoA ligase